MTQADAAKMPLTMTTGVGPKRSTRYPSKGTNHGSVKMIIVNATCIAARPQWYLASSRPTNSVQPYCRVAIITMHVTPMASCSHLFVRNEAYPEEDCAIGVCLS